jgi:hypothetical protein
MSVLLDGFHRGYAYYFESGSYAARINPFPQCAQFDVYKRSSRIVPKICQLPSYDRAPHTLSSTSLGTSQLLWLLREILKPPQFPLPRLPSALKHDLHILNTRSPIHSLTHI